MSQTSSVGHIFKTHPFFGFPKHAFPQNEHITILIKVSFSAANNQHPKRQKHTHQLIFTDVTLYGLHNVCKLVSSLKCTSTLHIIFQF